MIKRVCSECGKEISKSGRITDIYRVTSKHGVCNKCFIKSMIKLIRSGLATESQTLTIKNVITGKNMRITGDNEQIVNTYVLEAVQREVRG